MAAELTSAELTSADEDFLSGRESPATCSFASGTCSSISQPTSRNDFYVTEQASSTDSGVERLEWIKQEMNVDEFQATAPLGPSDLLNWSPQNVEQHVEEVFAASPLPMFATAESVPCNLHKTWVAPVPAVRSAMWAHTPGAQGSNIPAAQPAAFEEDAIFVDMAQYLEASHDRDYEQFHRSRAFERCGSKRKAVDYGRHGILEHTSD